MSLGDGRCPCACLDTLPSCERCGDPPALRRVMFGGEYAEVLCADCWLTTMVEIAGRVS